MTPSQSRPPTSRFLSPALILLAASVATAPILLHGSWCGDDFEFHLTSWFDAQQSWLHGIPYPHWMASANYGAGEPRFIFYPPLTWMLGAALRFLLPWPAVPIALVFLLLAATGFAVRALALEALPEPAATLAGCTALFSGFALFTAYERTAFAELSCGFWIPLALLFALRDRNPSGRLWPRALNGSALPLALVVAGCWVSNGPAGVMATYLVAAVAAAASLLARTWAHVLRATVAATLGIALAGLYLLPAAWEQGLVDLRAAIEYPVFRIETNWLFARHAEARMAPFDAVLHRASLLAVIAIGLAGAGLLVFLLRRRGAAHATPLSLRWWVPLALIPAGVLFLQFPVSLPVWNLLPRLRYLQYPWRWVLVVEAPSAIFFAAAVWPSRGARRWARPAAAALCAAAFLAVAFFAGSALLRTCAEGDTAAELHAAYQLGGLEGTDEYEPPGADHWNLARGLPDACFTANPTTPLGAATPDDPIPVWRPEQGSCETEISFQLHQPEHLRLATTLAHPGFVVLRLMRYPAWRATVNGRPVAPTDESALRDDGLIAVPVPQGRVDLAIDWTTTPDVVAGRCLSIAAVLLLVALALIERRFSRSPAIAA